MFLFSCPAGHTERAMLYHELEDGMYSVTSYFFAKVSCKFHHQVAAVLHNTLLHP